MINLYEELLSVIDVLNRAEIEYAVCGGIAVALHGYSRFTKDIDLLIKVEDIDRVTSVVKQIGFDLVAGPMLFDVGTNRERVIYRISEIDGVELLSLGLISVTPALAAVWESRELFEWQQRQLPAVSAEGLATMKRLAGREQDRLDLIKLGFEPGGEDSDGSE